VKDDGVRLLPPRGNHARKWALALFALAPFAFGALALHLGQDVNWDFRNYHWYNAYAFLNDRADIDILPSQLQYFLNPLIDVPFYMLATHVPAQVAGFALGWVQGLNFILLFILAYTTLLIADGRFKVMACAALAALGMIGGGGLAELGTTFYDNVTSLGILLSALLVVRHVGRLLTLPLRDAFLHALIFGVPAGLAMGLKLPGVIFCIGLCFAFFGAGGARPRRFWLSFAFGLGVLLGAAITYGYWGWFLETRYANPFFPFFNAIFKSPLIQPVNMRDAQFVPHNLMDFAFFPFLFAMDSFRVGEVGWRDWRIPMLYALLPAVLLLRLFFGRRRAPKGTMVRDAAAKYLLWAAAIAYFIWLGTSCIYRYLLPLEMLAPLLIVFTVDMLAFDMEVKPRAWLAVLLLVAVALSIAPGGWQRRHPWTEHYVEERLPPLGDTSDLMVLMAGFDPYSYLATLLPPEVPVVRIQSNFSGTYHNDWFNVDFDESRDINKILRARLNLHQGRFLMLTSLLQYATAEKALAEFGLGFVPAPCAIFTDSLTLERYMAICPVARFGPCKADPRLSDTASPLTYE
jgi:hypothetical protein